MMESALLKEQTDPKIGQTAMPPFIGDLRRLEE